MIIIAEKCQSTQSRAHGGRGLLTAFVMCKIALVGCNC